MTDDIGRPTLVASAEAVARDVARGKCAAFLHEWAALEDISPQQWRERVEAFCEVNQIPCKVQVFAAQEVTVVVNPQNCPNDAQLNRIIQSLVRFRESET